MNITELKELAEKATPGPWEWDGDVSNYDPENEAPWLAQAPWTSRDSKNVLMGTIKAVRAEDAAYIAAANPAEILELIANLEDAQGEIRALRATEAGLRESLAELVEAADSMRGTYTFQQGKTPEHEDHYGHEAWAGEFLHERAEAARALLEKKE